MTATADRYQQSPMELRCSELWDVLEQRHPESRDLLIELRNLEGAVAVAVEQRSIRYQGEVILAAIRGDLTAWPGCMPDWIDQPAQFEPLEVSA